MKFVIHAAALNGDDTALDLIDRLVDRVADEVHRMDMPEADLLQGSTWYQKARATRRKLLMSAVAKPLRVAIDGRGPHVKTVEVLDAESASLADKLAHASLVILVEDRESDGAFLDLVVEELGWPALQALWVNGRKITPRAVDVATAGGKGAIPQRIDRVVADATEEGRPPRLFVLCDSDARWPNDANGQIEREVAAVRAACARHGVPCHVWRKRCAESYIPDQVFEAVREDPANSKHVDRFNALLRRSPVQRNHLPIKDGLRPEERAEAIQAGLYAAAEEDDLKLLETSLFPRRPRPMLQLTQNRRGSFTGAGLEARDGEGELDALLRSIAQEL